MNSIQSFSAKGLPYISKNFDGDRYSATRHKIRKWIETEFNCDRQDIKRIYVNMDTADIQFTVNNKCEWIEQLRTMIRTSPTGEIRFSWEKKLGNDKIEKDWLQAYKASIYLSDMYKSYEALKTNREIVMNLYKQLDFPIYDKYIEEQEFENEWEMFLLQNEIDEILCEKEELNEDIEDITSMLSDLTLKRKRSDSLIFTFGPEDFEPPSKKMNIEETFESEKETWTPQEICEKIRLLQVCGNIKISTEDMNKITQEFGERRVMKENPLHIHGSAPSDAEKADRSDPLPSMDVFKLMEENERLKKNYRLALEEIDIIRYHYQV